MAEFFENPRFIAIEGPIRAGKSTSATLLAQEIGATRIIEPQQNPFLSPFYRGDRSAAFPAQMWFLMSRYEQLCCCRARCQDRQSRSHGSRLHFRKRQAVRQPEPER